MHTLLSASSHLSKNLRYHNVSDDTLHNIKAKSPGGRVFIYISVRGSAAEQGIIFRIPTPGQGITFVKIGSITGSIFVIFDSERSF